MILLYKNQSKTNTEHDFDVVKIIMIIISEQPQLGYEGTPYNHFTM